MVECFEIRARLVGIADYVAGDKAGGDPNNIPKPIKHRYLDVDNCPSTVVNGGNREGSVLESDVRWKGDLRQYSNSYIDDIYDGYCASSF